jgi:hypothetical protein
MFISPAFGTGSAWSIPMLLKVYVAPALEGTKRDGGSRSIKISVASDRKIERIGRPIANPNLPTTLEHAIGSIDKWRALDIGGVKLAVRSVGQ